MPDLSIERFANVAPPADALVVVVPDSVPPPGLFPIATVIDAVEEVIVFPKLSCTVAVVGPGIAVPAIAFPGWVVNAICEADPAAILNVLLVAPVNPVADAVSV